MTHTHTCAERTCTELSRSSRSIILTTIPLAIPYCLSAKGWIRLFVFCLLVGGLPTVSFAQPTLVWAKSMGGVGPDIGYSIALDGSGNIYTTGRFFGTADFDPGAATYNLTSVGSYDIFVSKLDTSGNFLWAKSMGGTGTEIGFSIVMDGSGNVYTTGQFDGTVDFDPDPAGTYTLTSAGYSDIFVSKLDASGNFLWAKRMGGTGTDADVGYSIAIDGSGNVYTTGAFDGTADFDPGVAAYNLTSAGSFDIFVSKLDASGNFLWAKSMAGSGWDYGISVALDGNGNVFTTGRFEGTVDFDPGATAYNLTALGFSNTFISKLDPSGNFLWAKRMGGAGGGSEGYSIALDGSGNVFTTGYFYGTADFDPSVAAYNLTSAGVKDIFVSKLDVSGNFLWAKRIGGTLNEYAKSIALDILGDVYIRVYVKTHIPLLKTNKI